MAASMRVKFLGMCRRLEFNIHHQSLQCQLHPSGQVFNQQVRWKMNQSTRFKAPHEAKDQAKWTKQKKTDVVEEKVKHVRTRTVVDDVWIRAHYAKPVYSALHAIEMHKEYAQPAMLNNVDGKIIAKLTLDFTTKKKTKFLKPFQQLTNLPHPWDHGETRNIVAFCKEPEQIAAAEELGAVYAGGLELVKKIERAEVLREEFDYIISTYELATELIKIRSMIKDLFPNKKNGNLGENVRGMMEHLKNGHRYQVKKTASEKEGVVDIEFGDLTMTNEQLEENLKAFIDAICTHRSPDLGPFVKEALFLCLPSNEKFLVDLTPFLPKSKKQLEEEIKEEEDQAEDSDEENVAARA